MKLTQTCIRRPVLSTVISLVLMILGLVSWSRLQVRQYPNIDQPQISVWTQLEGAGPEIIETQITKILENAFAGIEGLESMVSRSEISNSRITLTFEIGRNIDAAANDVRDKISRNNAKLPEGIVPPVIKKADADAVAFMNLALYSDRHDVRELADYAKRYLETRLEAVPGVSSIDVFGGGEYEMKIILDPVKLSGYNLTPEDVAASLKKQNIEKPAGNLVTSDRELVVTTKARLTKEADFDRVIIGEKDGYLIRVSDVGHAELNAIDRQNRVLFNGQSSVSIGITKQSVGNALTIAQDVKKILPDIRLAKGMKLEIARDRTIFMERSIDEVYETIIIATLLVILVIFAFLRSGRAVLIPLVTIPLSLIGAFALMYALGFTINILTLLALVLAIGLVVDDAIVMLENVHRYIEEGETPLRAAFKGAKEISFAIIAMTITLAAVYAPIALSPGMTGKLFTEFAITLAGAVLLSGLIALTLTPMMCGRLLAPLEEEHAVHGKWGRISQRIGELLDSLDNGYARLLRFCLERRVWVMGAGAAIAFLGYVVGLGLPTELVPREDQGFVIARAIPPFGANLDYTDKYMEQVDKILSSVPEATDKRLTMISAPGESTSMLSLKNWEDRKRSSKDITDDLREPLAEVTGLTVYPSMGGKTLVGGGENDTPIEIVVQTNKSHKELTAAGKKVEQLIGKLPGVSNVLSDIGSLGQEYVITIDRDKAAALGVDVSTISDTLHTLIGGRPASRFIKESKEYAVRVEIEEKFRRSPEDLTGLFIKGVKDKRDSLVPLSEIVTITKQLAPTEIGHFMGFRSMLVTAKLDSGYSLGDTLVQIKQQANEILPEGVTVDFSGESRRYLKESSNVYMIFGLALAFIFLVLAAQYESWRDPWIIMLSVPLSLAGGIFLLKLFGQSMNLYSQIGLVTLIGLITKHGILIVDFANKRKEDGLDRLNAVIEASKLRLRPILMTTFAMVLGAVPLAFAAGAGAESRRPIGLVIVGGMTLGTLFTLFVVPAVYTFLSSKAHKPLVDVPEDV